MRILVAITTHKRAEWCLSLLKQLKKQGNGMDLQVVVFHDKDETDYIEVMKYCKSQDWRYFRTKENFGKWGHWKFYNIIYTYLDTQDYDIFIQLPDDVELIDKFFQYSLFLLDGYKAINILTLNQHVKTFKLNDDFSASISNWIDGCFVTKKKYIQGLRLKEPYNSANRIEEKGSGSGNEFSKAFIKKNGSNTIGMTNYALVYHKGFNGSTVMHDTTKWLHTNREYYQSRMYIEPKLETMLKGKSVAFVGMASNILGKGLGEEIDAHDIVYRTNMFPIPEELQADYGKRCDILGLQAAYHVNLEAYKKAGIKTIVHYGNKEYDNLKGFNVKVATEQYRKNIADTINAICTNKMCKPTAGLVALFLCKQAKCKSFKYYGITGYQNLNGEVENHNGTNHYNKIYLDYWGDRKDKLLKTDMVHNKYHNFAGHNEYLRKIIALNQVEIDEYSKQYFI